MSVSVLCQTSHRMWAAALQDLSVEYPYKSLIPVRIFFPCEPRRFLGHKSWNAENKDAQVVFEKPQADVSVRVSPVDNSFCFHPLDHSDSSLGSGAELEETSLKKGLSVYFLNQNSLVWRDRNIPDGNRMTQKGSESEILPSCLGPRRIGSARACRSLRKIILLPSTHFSPHFLFSHLPCLSVLSERWQAAQEAGISAWWLLHQQQCL